MSKKYHKKLDGTPGECRAYKRGCPLGGSNEHFETLEEAQQFCDKVNEEYAIYDEESCLYYNPTEEVGTGKITLNDLWKSKSRFSRIEAIRNGYVPSYADLEKDEAQSVKTEAIEQGLYLDRFCYCSDVYLIEKAARKVRDGIPQEYDDDDYDFAYKVRTGDLRRELQNESGYDDEVKLGKVKVRELNNFYNINIDEDKFNNKYVYIMSDTTLKNSMFDYAYGYSEHTTINYPKDVVDEFEKDLLEIKNNDENKDRYKEYPNTKEGLLKMIENDDYFFDEATSVLNNKIVDEDEEGIEKIKKIQMKNGKLYFYKGSTPEDNIWLDLNDSNY